MINESLDFNFEPLKNFLYIMLIVFTSNLIVAGNSDKETIKSKVVSGRITDVYGESIPGAKIVIPETGETFFADLDGNFKFTLKTDKEYSVTINTLGFEPLEVKSSRLTAFSDLSLKSL